MNAPAWTIESATAWRLAALADGWTERPTYIGQPVEEDATLYRDGWQAMISARPPSREGLRHFASVSVWGPDELTVRVPEVYSFEALQADLTKCHECGKEGPTVRLGFCNRVCQECRTRLAPTVEHPGWAE